MKQGVADKRLRYRLLMLSLILAWLLLCPVALMAQTDSHMSMYWAVPTQFNPAAAGSDSALHVAALGRKQWVGLDDAPQSFFVAADMPFKIKNQRSGVGISVQNVKAGIRETNIIGAQYSYSRRLRGGRLALGLQAGVVDQKIKEAGKESGMSMDLGLGAYYEKTIGRKQVYVALSAMHLTQPKVVFDTCYYSQQKSNYYFLVGCNIPTRNTLFIIQPSMLLRANGDEVSVDCSLRATYRRRFWGGIAYRFDDAVVLMAGADIGAIRIGYAYDIGTSDVARSANGSHELMVSYVLKLNFDKKERRPLKSIRIL